MAQLAVFFAYCDLFGLKEHNEHEKLLFFHPKDASSDRKMNHVGLCEAVFKYTSTFSTQPAETMHTLKTRQVFLNPEPNIYLSLIIKVPQRKEGAEQMELVQDGVLLSMLKQAYQLFLLLHGPSASVLDRFGRLALIEKFESFFSSFLASVDFAKADLLDALNGIQFLPLDKNSYLRVQCLVNQIEVAFPCIVSTVFLFNDHVVWSGLEQDDIRALYRFLTGGFFDMTKSGAKAGSAAGLSSPGAGASPGALSGGYFLTGPADLADDESPIQAPRVFVSQAAGDNSELYLIVYACGETKICFLINATALMDLKFYRALHDMASAPIAAMRRDMAMQQAKRAAGLANGGEIQYKYLYFNHMNLAEKSSFAVLPRMVGDSVLASAAAPEHLHLLSEMHDEFERSPDDSEVILKTQKDFWIVGRKSDQREFFVILSRNTNLYDIHEEVRRIGKTHFHNIFFID